MRKAHHALPWLFRYLILGPGRIYETLKYDPLIETHALNEHPVFVLGHWRSGTSFLQELLSLDERYATCTLFQCLFADCLLSTRRWLPPLIDGMASTLGIRYPIQDRPLSASLPAEEEIAMLCLTDPDCSNWGQIFPKYFQDYIPRDARPNEEWLAGYDYVVRKLSFASGGKRLVLKSPMNTARLAVLQAAYPDAVFVHIHRHPLDVYASSRRLWKMILGQSALQHLTTIEFEQLILDAYELVSRRYLDDLASVSSERLVDVAYEELKADPARIVDDIYARLGLGTAPTERIRQFTEHAEAPSIKPRDLDASLEERIRERWAFAFVAWGYD